MKKLWIRIGPELRTVVGVLAVFIFFVITALIAAKTYMLIYGEFPGKGFQLAHSVLFLFVPLGLVGWYFISSDLMEEDYGDDYMATEYDPHTHEITLRPDEYTEVK